MAIKAWGALLAVGLMLAAAVIFHKLRADPEVAILTDADGCGWVRAPARYRLEEKLNVSTAVMFETRFDVPPGFAGADLHVTALRQLDVTVDDRRLWTDADGANWKVPRTVRIPPMEAGPHRLFLSVTDPDGPSLVRAGCPPLEIATGTAGNQWQATTDGRGPAPVVRADADWEPEIPGQYTHTLASLVRCSPLLIAAFMAGFFACCGGKSEADWGSRTRWLVLLGWGVLAVNNLFKVPLSAGYDIAGHYDYIRFIAEHHRLPRGDQGWQYFQSPLFYVVSAGLQRIFVAFGAGAELTQRLLRIIPLACGALMVEISLRAARLVFPGRADLTAVAVAVGGLVPVNLYMAQSVSNEPMSAAAAGVVILLCLRLIADPASVRSVRHLVCLGVAVGVATLTKISALIWMVPIAMAIAVANVRDRGRHLDLLRAAIVISTAALCVCGWYFVRNLLQIGRPFFTESTVAGVAWWQDPGYRTPRMFYEFGNVFNRSIFNGTQSVWDSLYGTLWGQAVPVGLPPWNYNLMASSLWLGIVPTGLIFTGIIRGFGRSEPAAITLRWSTLAVAIYLAAVLYVFVRLPIYSCAKASYMLAAVPCLAILAAGGFKALDQWRLPRAFVAGFLWAGGVAAYLTFLVS